MLAVTLIPGGSAAAHADLLIELPATATQAQRILVQPPRVRLETDGVAYQLYDADMDAMVTVRPDYGVFYEEDPASLETAGRRFAATLNERRAGIERRLSGDSAEARSQWEDILEQWRAEAPAEGAGAGAAERIASIAPDEDPESVVAGIQCRSMRVTLHGSDDRMLVCLAPAETLSATPEELRTLVSMFRYMERLRHAARARRSDPLTIPPGLLAAVMDRTGMFVLGAARWNAGASRAWEVADLWPGRLDASQFAVPGHLREIAPPYAD